MSPERTSRKVPNGRFSTAFGRFRPSSGSRVVLRHLLDEPVQTRLVDLDKPLRLAAEVENIAGVNVEPESVDVKVVGLEPLSKKPVAGDVLNLLQTIDLEEEMKQRRKWN